MSKKRELITQAFTTSMKLADFVNENNISDKDIKAIVFDDTGRQYILFFYVYSYE